MKKLFVLFLLVALVPFTVGCGLFGDNDDTTPINIAKMTASASGVKLPANMRGAAIDDVNAKKVTLTINGIVLSPVAAVLNADGTYNIDFQALLADSVNLARYNEVVAGGKEVVLTVTTVSSNGVTTSNSALITPPAITTGNQLQIPVDTTTGAIKTDAIKVVTEAAKATVATVPAVVLPQGQTTVTALDYTVTNGGVALATTTADAREVNAAAPAFAITLTDSTKTLDVAKISYNIMVRNVNGLPAVALTDANFGKNPQTGSLNTVTLTTLESASKNLKAGQVYEVNVIAVADGTNKLMAKKFYFKAI